MISDVTSHRRAIAPATMFLVLCANAWLAGCGDDANDDAKVADAGKSSDAGAADSGKTAALLDPPEAGHGIQFTMKTELAPSEESERCQFVQSGDEELLVNHDEARFTTGSHHVLLFLTSYTEVPTRDLQGHDVDTSGVFDCSQGVQGFWSAQGLVAASQSPHGESAISFPAGVALRIPAKSVLLINTHYINTSDKSVRPEVYINLHTLPASEVEHEGGLLFWYNPFLKAPANDTSEMLAGCPIPHDIKITNAQSHMHRRGVGYSATLIAPDDSRMEIYSSHTWEDVPVKAFDPNVVVAAGSRIEWQCNYQNNESHDVYQGPRSSDEMCMFIGSYYPRDEQTGFCARGKQAFLNAEWKIGKGTASYADSFSCIIGANSKASSVPGVATGRSNQALYSGITDCLLASKLEVSSALSNVLGCVAASGASAAAEKCGAEIAACETQ